MQQHEWLIERQQLLERIKELEVENNELRKLMKSYNIPEFMHGPVKTTPQGIADVLKTNVDPVKYVQQLSK